MVVVAAVSLGSTFDQLESLEWEVELSPISSWALVL